MIRWNYIAKKMADKYASPGNLAHWTPEHLARCWKSLFDYNPESHYDHQTMSGNYAIIYNFVMTIANTEGSDEEKVGDILRLIEEIWGTPPDAAEVTKILKGGGYNSEVVPAAKPQQLLKHRTFHAEVLSHGEKFFDQGHYTTAVNEVCKAYNNAVKAKARSQLDGQALMLWAFSDKGPLRINAYKTESEINEQEGIKFLSAGLMRGLRNPTSHETAKTWKFDEEECIEILSLASYLFKKLDAATTVTTQP
ncbi:MAG TPA: TIGR02391 family protein [Chitinophagaceae bacterium]|nr:TIGR02391 family protein [Chitinophagaceae bacterium]